MSNNLILKQIQTLWCDLRDPKTGGTLLQALARLWHLLVQLFLLGLLVALLAFAAIVSFWGMAYQGGRDDRQWIDAHPNSESNEFAMYVIGKNLLAPLKWLVALAQEIFRVVLGIKVENSALSTTSEKPGLLAATLAPINSLVSTATAEKVEP